MGALEGCRREAGGSGGVEMRRRAAQGTFQRSHPTNPGPEVRCPGSEGSVAAPAIQVSCLRLRIGRYRYVAQHRIALREACALPPSHIISHALRPVALCRRWQRWSIENIDLKVLAGWCHLNADRGCSSSMRDVRVGVGCWEWLEVGRGYSPARSKPE